jgi:hypothetical protein
MKDEEVRIVRYFRIDEEIRAGNMPTAKHLAGVLGVTERTVYRYIDNMRLLMNAPISCAAGTGGYYYDDPDYSISSLSLSENEYQSLVMAQHLLYALFGPGFRLMDAGKGFNSLIGRASKAVKAKQLDVKNCVQVALPMIGNCEAFPVIIDSMYEKRPVRFSFGEDVFITARVIRIVYAFDSWFMLYITGRPRRAADFKLVPVDSVVKVRRFPEGKTSGIPVDYQNVKSTYTILENYGDARIVPAPDRRRCRSKYHQTLCFSFETKEEMIELVFRRGKDGGCMFVKNASGMCKNNPEEMAETERMFDMFDKLGKNSDIDKQKEEFSCLL